MKFLKIFKRLEIQVISAMILGILAGMYFPEEMENIFWVGDLFMKLLKVLLGPLLFFSILVAILGLGDMKKLGSIGLRTFAYYMLTTALAIFVCLFMMNIFKPGVGMELFTAEFNSASEKITFSSFMLNLVPDNIMNAFIDLNAMQIVIVAILLGVAILATKNKGQIDIVDKFINGVNDGILKFITWVIKLTPIGVFAIIAKVVSENGADKMLDLLPFVGIAMISLIVHALIILPIFGIFFGKFNPFLYFLKVRKSILVGFSTASSAATMGLTMDVAKNKAKLNEEVVNFTFPLGTTVNMNGTALYQAGIAICVAQAIGMPLDFFAQLTIILTVILASVGAAGIPGAGMIILTTVFITIGLPIEAIGIFMSFDRILDMFRTAVNIWGDLITAKIVDNHYNENLKSFGEKLSEKIGLED